MTSIMSATKEGGVGEEATSSSGGSAGCLGFSAVGPTEEAARVSVSNSNGADETRVSDNVNDRGTLKLENQGTKVFDAIGGDNQVTSSSSASGMLHVSRKQTKEELEHNKNRTRVEDYDSVVGNGYKIGDMVWGKVKSHPWWPGYIYNEAFASRSVRRSKQEGQVLVAFFGDSSYGWFDPKEIIPFQENFAEKSKQAMFRTFLIAVNEALDELSRRRSLGLACRCRNEFNFWPANFEGYFVVDVGDSEPGVYGSSQISRARDTFRPREMLSFLKQLALDPTKSHQHSTVNFVEEKATVLACRKVMFKEFDETYAQAFGTVPVRPPRPTAPVTVDPSKAPLSGRLVIAETLQKGKKSVRPANTKDNVEKDNYLFKRREELILMRRKKASSRQSNTAGLDGRGISGELIRQASLSAITDGHHQPIHKASISSDIKSSGGTSTPTEGGTKKGKVTKRQAEELIDNAVLVEKKKKMEKKNNEISNETSAKLVQLPVAVGKTVVAVDNVSRMTRPLLLTDNNVLNNQKKDAVQVDFAKVELQMLVRDLRALALSPSHGEERSCPAVIRQIFLKYRSLVYQKSLVVNSTAAAVLVGPADKTNAKIVNPSVRLEDPTRGGKKCDPPDRPDGIKKRKIDDVLEQVKKMKAGESWKKKKIDDPKKKSITESERGDLKEISANKKNTPPPTLLPRAVKTQEYSNKRMEREANPTMLVMKFLGGAALPSSAELRAKFARFGPMDHSATRVFWKSNTCQIVYLHKVDAENAIKFADGSSNLFGNSNFKCYLREHEAKAAAAAAAAAPPPPQSESVKQKDPSVLAPKMAARQQPLPPPVQLKSCLKKPLVVEEGGGGRGSRVKIVSGGDDHSIKGDVLFNESRNTNIATIPEVPTSSVHLLGGVNTIKILPRLNPQSSNTPPNDISRQMLNLLMRCNDVVNNLTSALGYLPYHPL